MSIWDDSAEQYRPGGRPAYWEALPLVATYQNRRSSGHPDRNAVNVVREHLAALTHRPRRLLWLGCLDGDPSPDMDIALAGLAEEIHVHDIAEGLIVKQRERTAARGIDTVTHTVTDLNTAVFPPNHYDVVIGWGTIHHVEALEHLFAQVKRTLVPGGLFAFREYVGPDRIQFTVAQLDLTNRLLTALPPQRRRHADDDTVIVQTAIAPPLEHLLAADPSESVRSAAILPIARRMFPGIDVRDTGGTLLHPLLAGIAWNFEDPDGQALITSFIELEETLIDTGRLPSDYCTAYWVKPATRRLFPQRRPRRPT